MAVENSFEKEYRKNLEAFDAELIKAGWNGFRGGIRSHKGDWSIAFDTSTWMELYISKNRTSHRSMDIPLPKEYLSAWTVNLIEHILTLEDQLLEQTSKEKILETLDQESSRSVGSVNSAKVKAAELLNVQTSVFDESAKEFPEIEAYYLWENIRGGRALVIGYDGSVLLANSSVRPTDHRQAFVDGRRTPLEQFE